MKKRLQEALSDRKEAKNDLVRVLNDKNRKKKKILEYYKKFKKADDAFISVYEDMNCKGEKYAKCA